MKRTDAREIAFKTLFQLDVNEEGTTLNEYKNDYIATIIRGVQTEKESLDAHINQALDNWTIERLPLPEKTLLRVAFYEIMHVHDIPYAVSVNEAVELAHKYGDEKSGQFINGVLAKISKEE